MKIINNIRVFGVLSAVVVTLVMADRTMATEQPPNILFIMADDHTTQAIGAYGGRLAPLNPTPNIDALASNGMRFDRVFCNNSICTPSRATIITGQYSQTNGVLDLRGAIPPERQFLPIELKKAGYQTAMIGKWHLKQEPAAFDYYCVLPGQGTYFDPTFRIRGDKPWGKNTIQKKGQHSTDCITDISLAWLADGRDKSKPFFLMFHFKAPHAMFINAKRYDNYLADVEIPEPKNLFNPPSGSAGSRNMGTGIGRKHAPWKLAERLNINEDLDDLAYTKASYQKYLKRYLRCVKGVDDNVKRIIDYLKEAGEFENTIIIYTGDQGFFLGEHDLMDKRWMYEEAFRMPFIVHWPKRIKGGSSNDWLINNGDFAPTILALAGVKKTPHYMQGRSFASALQGETKPGNWRKVTYYRYWMHQVHRLAVPAHFGIRSDRYKLIFFYGVDYRNKSQWTKNNPFQRTTPAAWEFYDLDNDPFEMNNLYDDSAYQPMIAQMKMALKETRQTLNETDDKRPIIQSTINAHW